ncbi:MAG: SH3 domain-containing protein [Clostridia bacterium]|nr:SH3 domain-containing protein [Clostridia bacterium]MCI9413253.1 SH3 domain-containing protein [Clostridia bacterium]
MKKCLIISLIMMLVILGVLTLGTSTVKGAVSMSGTTSVKQGDTVTITVSYGEKVRTAQFIFNYDASKLTYKSAVGGSYNSATGRFSVTSEEAIDTLSSATFTFTAKATGTATFNISNVIFKSVDKGKFNPAISTASISTTIQDKTTPKPDQKPDQKPDPKPDDKPNQGGNSGNNSGSSTNKPTTPTFTGGTATVYAKETVSIRDSWSTSGKLLGTLQKGKSITRTGIGSNGWTRVNYNGKVAYISSQYLTTTKPKDDDKKDNDKKDDKNNTKNETNNATNNETTNNEVNNTTNNVENDEVNNTTNELTNNEHQGSNEVKNEKKDDKNNIEFIIIGVIIAAILVIIVSEILAKKKNKKKGRK